MYCKIIAHVFDSLIRKIILSVTLVLGTILPAMSLSYNFSSVSGTYTPNSSPIVIHTAGVDDAISSAINIGFGFSFGSCTTISYSQVKVSSNGWLSLGTDATGSQSTNDMAWSSYGALIAPLWDDLKIGTGGSVNYQLFGSSGNRVFVVEWLNMRWNWSASADVVSFQVKLYEQNGKIEFVYRQEAGSINSGTASIGINGGALGDYYSLNNSGTSPSAIYGTATNNISSKPATGQIYRWELPTVMTYVSATVTQASSADTYQTSSNQEIICLPVIVSGGCLPFNLTQIAIDMGGTTNIADVVNIDIYYTGNTAVYASSVLFGSVVPGTGTLYVNGTQTLQNGVNYFWVVYDVSATATIGNVLDARCTQFTMTFPGGTQAPSASDPSGSRPIVVKPASFSKWIEKGWARSVIESSDGNIVWAGLTTNSYSSGNSDAYIIKTNTDLSVINWTCVFGTAASSDYIEDIVETADGYIAVGYSNMSGGASGYNIMVTKVNLSGIVQWTRLIGTSGTDYGYGITKTLDGNVAICGYEGSYSDGYFAKLNNANGSIMAEKTINTTGTTYLNDIVETSDGGFLMVGKANGNDFCIIKIKADYTLDWARRWDGGNIDELKFVAENGVNDYTVAGTTYSYGAGSSDGYVMRFTWDGTNPVVAWTEAIGSSTGNTFNDGYKTNDGYIFTGITTRLGDDLNHEVFISKITKTGSNVFMKSVGTYNPGEDQEGYGISALSDGSIVIAGLHNSVTSNFYLVKMSSGGFSCATVQDNGGIMLLPAPSFITDGSVSSPFGFSYATPFPTLNTGGVIANDGCLILPVEMAFFTGIRTANGNLLTWGTASEVNCESFTIERSMDASNWSAIGNVPGSGNSNILRTYSFTDETFLPGTAYYYRLRETDYDGKSYYSEAVFIDGNPSGSQLSEVRVFPNPGSGQFCVLLPELIDNCSLDIISVTGQVLQNMAISSDSHVLDMDIRSLPEGTYYLRISNQSETIFRRIVLTTD